MAENVRVVVRCRPMNKREHELKCCNIIQIEDCAVSVQNPADLNVPAKTFTYDSVYDALAPTEAIYNDICYSLVENVLEGYNGTIFAYGQTGCGKTHTMQGPDNYENDSTAIQNSQRGIITRSFDHIFEAISVASGVQYLALVSYLEIYNENIRDLLNQNESINANHALKEVPGIGLTVPTLSTYTVHNANECYELLSMGNRNRMVGSTLMNATSSRSHSIFTISLEQIHKAAADVDIAHNFIEGHVVSGIRRGKLNLVDLAGSERQNKTGAIGERLKEATKINLSLSALGNVISALVDGKTKHIPYRDSKLTRLLQDSLGGNTKTLMISCISPADNNYDETISTLRYASRAKSISNKPKINEDPKDAKLREYQEEIMKLKQMLNESHTQNPTDSSLSNLRRNSGKGDTSTALVADELTNREWLENERAKLKIEMEQEMERLKEEHKEKQREKDEQMHEMKQLRNHYEDQIKRLSTANCYEQRAGGQIEMTSTSALQLEARKRIELIKRALIGGERANDVQLKERRQKKKVDAQRRLSALAQVLSRVEQSADRDLLQGHYTNIQQELSAKNEYLKAYRQKVKALEREVSDLQAEFQLDRADYLESIRRLERSLKFYQQIMDKALPILRKDGKYWDPNEIIQNSSWNDDLKVWKLPESSMSSFKLPATANTSVNSKHYFENTAIKIISTPNENINNGNKDYEEHVNNEEHKTQNQNDTYKIDILNNYFRSNRQKTSDLTHQRKGFNFWKDFAQRSKRIQQQHILVSTSNEGPLLNSYSTIGSLSNILDDKAITPSDMPIENRILSSWLPPQSRDDKNILMNKTWGGGAFDKLLTTTTTQNYLKIDPIIKTKAHLNVQNSANFRNRLLSPPSPQTTYADELLLSTDR